LEHFAWWPRTTWSVRLCRRRRAHGEGPRSPAETGTHRRTDAADFRPQFSSRRRSDKSGKETPSATHRFPENQALYHGIVKPREAKHDAELYRLFHAEAARIESAGGRPLRVILDYELKSHVNQEREQLGERQNDRHEIATLAARHGLAVVNGKIPLPDVRIEYQTRIWSYAASIWNWRRATIAREASRKAKAGFALYSPREDAPRLRRILDEQELTARIFAL